MLHVMLVMSQGLLGPLLISGEFPVEIIFYLSEELVAITSRSLPALSAVISVPIRKYLTHVELPLLLTVTEC